MTEEKTSGQKTEYCKKFLQLAENLDEMVYKMDIRSGEFEYVNQSSVNITGYTPEEFYQTPFLIKRNVGTDITEYFAQISGFSSISTGFSSRISCNLVSLSTGTADMEELRKGVSCDGSSWRRRIKPSEASGSSLRRSLASLFMKS